MAALTRSSSLRELILTIDFNPDNPPKTPLSEARNFLKASTGMLKDIVLDYPEHDEEINPDAEVGF